MRIAIVHNPPPGGARHAMGELIRRLAGRHRLDVFQLGDGDRGWETSSESCVNVVSFRPRPRLRLAFPLNDALALRDLQILEALGRALAARIDSAGYDCVLATTTRGMFVPPVLAHLHTPSLYYCHERPLGRFYGRIYRPGLGQRSRYERARAAWQRPTAALVDVALRSLALRHARSATRLVANSRYTATWIQAVYGRTADVGYLGVNAARFRPSQCAGAGLFSVGAFEAHKGFDFLVRAVGRIPAHCRPPLTIAGSPSTPSLPGRLRCLAQREGVQLRLVTAAGAQAQGTEDDLISLYQAHALFLFGAHEEPFGLVLLEAMASGLPVIAVREGATAEVVTNGRDGLLVERDEADFAQAISRLLNNAGERQAMGEAARAAAQLWDWDTAARRLEELLRRTAAQAPEIRGGRKHAIFTEVGG